VFKLASVKFTVSGAQPDNGDAMKSAVGALSVQLEGVSAIMGAGPQEFATTLLDMISFPPATSLPAVRVRLEIPFPIA